MVPVTIKNSGAKNSCMRGGATFSYEYGKSKLYLGFLGSLCSSGGVALVRGDR